jgi:hypothetical protein
MYSYIKPKKKTPLTQEVILIVSFFSISFLMLFTTYGFLAYKDYKFEKDMNQIENKKQELKISINNLQDRIKFIEQESNLANKIYTTNSVLKDSISNLFDLVPERITLSKAQILKNGLILFGITPNKEIYEYMLEAPLRSIFAKNHTSFYQLENGWLRFVSTNYLDNNFEDLADEN